MKEIEKKKENVMNRLSECNSYGNIVPAFVIFTDKIKNMYEYASECIQLSFGDRA